jgi:hypothetical protein
VLKQNSRILWAKPLEEHWKGWEGFNWFISFKVGDGSSLKFWHDSWCGGILL